MNPTTPSPRAFTKSRARSTCAPATPGEEEAQVAVRTGIAVVAFRRADRGASRAHQRQFFTAGNLTNVLRQIRTTRSRRRADVRDHYRRHRPLRRLADPADRRRHGAFANASGLDGPLLVIATTIVGVAVGCCAGLVNAVPVVRLLKPCRPFIHDARDDASGLAFKLFSWAAGAQVRVVGASGPVWPL